MPTRRRAPFKFTPTNQNERGYKNYQDRTVNERMDPAATRVQLAHDRYMLLGTFNEIQLAGFDDYGSVIYRITASPNMVSQYNCTIARKGSKAILNIVRLNPFDGTTVAHKKIHDVAKNVHVTLKGGNVSDMDLIYDAWQVYCTMVGEAVSGTTTADFNTRL